MTPYLRWGLIAVAANVLVVLLVVAGLWVVALGVTLAAPLLLLVLQARPRPRPSDAGPLALAVGVNVAVLGVLAVGGAFPLLCVAVGVPALLAVARRPQRALLALVALTPFDGLLEVLPVPGFLDYWKEALAVVAMGATSIAPQESRGDPRRQFPGWRVACIGLVGLGALSAATVDPVQAVVGLKIAFFYLIVLVAVWRCPFDRRDRDWLVSILMGVGLVTAIIGLGQQAVGADRLNALGYEYDSTIRFAGGVMRSFSTFVQPFGFGFFLMVVLLVAIPVALDDSRRLRNRLFLGLLPVYGLALLTTIVRGAWLGLLLGLVYLGFHRYRLLLLGLPLAFLVLVAVPADAVSTALSSSSSVERAEGWQANVDRVIERPLGEGIGSTGSAALTVVRLGGDANTYQTDNYFFKMMLELGLLGLWLFVLGLAAVFGHQRRAAQRIGGPDGALCAGAAATTLGATAACFVASYFDIFPMDLLFWLLAGVVADLAARAGLDAEAAPEDEPEGRKGPAVGLEPALLFTKSGDQARE